MRQLCCCLFFFFFFFLAMCVVEPFMCLDPDTHRVKYRKPIMATTAVDFPVQDGHARGTAVVLHGGHQRPSENKIYWGWWQWWLQWQQWGNTGVEKENALEWLVTETSILRTMMMITMTTMTDGGIGGNHTGVICHRDQHTEDDDDDDYNDSDEDRLGLRGKIHWSD